MKNTINIKKYPISNKYNLRKLNCFYNLSFITNNKYHYVEIKNPIKPQFLQTRLSWLNESEPHDYFDKAKKLLKNTIIRNKSLVGLTYRDKKFIDYLKDCKFKNISYFNKTQYGLNSKFVGVSLIQKKLTDSSFLKKKLNKKKSKIILINHFIHHIHNLELFFYNLKEAMSYDDYAFIEVPDCESSLKKLDYTILFEEHTKYFTEVSLKKFFNKNGFGIKSFARYKRKYEDSLMFLIKINKNIQSIKYKDIRHNKFFLNFKKQKSMIRNFFIKNSDAYNFGIFGSGHHAVSFVSIFGLDGYIDFSFDDDKNKHFKYLPGSGIKILPSKYINKINFLIISITPDKEDMIINKLKNKYKNIILTSSNKMSRYFFI